MIQFFRKALTSWALLAVLGLVIVAFIVTGIGDPFGGRTARLVAKVGDERVTDTAFSEDFQRQFEMARQQQPELTQQQFVTEGGFDMVLRSLVQRTSLRALFEDAGLATGPKTLAVTIGAIPAFQLGGQFSTKAYQDALAAARPPLTPKAFEAGVAEDLIREQVLNRIGGGWQLPDKAVQAYARAFDERRVGTMTLVPADAMTGIALPADDVLARYYQGVQERFAAPEFRSFRALSLSPALLAERVQVTDADLKAAFDERAADLGGVETRTIEQVLVETPQAAQALIAQVQGGASFVAAAQAAVPGLTEADVSRAGVSERQLAEDVSAEAARAVFALPQGAMSAPIQSDLGVYVFRVAAVVAPKVPSIDAIRPQLMAEVRARMAIDRVYDLSKTIEDALAKGESLDAVAKAVALPVVTVPAVSRDGVPMASGPAPSVDPALLKLAFVHTQGDDLLLEQTGQDSFAVVEVTETVPTRVRPLAEVRPQVIAAWLREQQVAQARRIGEELAAAARQGGDLAALSAQRKLQTQSNISLLRAQILQGGDQVPEAIRALFRLPKGGAAVEASPDGQGVLVVQVTDVVPSQAAAGSEAFSAVRQLVDRSAQLEAQEQFVRAVMATLEVREYPERVKALRDQLLQTGAE